MTLFNWIQLVLAAAAGALVAERIRFVLFGALSVDGRALIDAIALALTRAERDRAREIADRAEPACAALVASAALRAKPGEERDAMEDAASACVAAANERLWMLRVLASTATALGTLGGVLELAAMASAGSGSDGHGLLGLEAGLAESIRLSRALQTMGIGVATALVLFESLRVLRRAARRVSDDLSFATTKLAEVLENPARSRDSVC